ncbi:MAG: hypothetical protein FWC38_00960 [Proteobacteria bacterium]|nr:hypothetical protein [Pseudomonadota bacterium]
MGDGRASPSPCVGVSNIKLAKLNPKPNVLIGGTRAVELQFNHGLTAGADLFVWAAAIKISAAAVESGIPRDRQGRSIPMQRNNIESSP